MLLGVGGASYSPEGWQPGGASMQRLRTTREQGADFSLHAPVLPGTTRPSARRTSQGMSGWTSLALTRIRTASADERESAARACLVFIRNEQGHCIVLLGTGVGVVVGPAGQHSWQACGRINCGAGRKVYLQLSTRRSARTQPLSSRALCV